MKKIYFDKANNPKNIILLIIALIFILIGFTDLLSDFGLEWSKRIQGIGYFLFALFFLRKVFRKNYVQWNKTGMTVRINNYIREKRIVFNDVLSFELNNGILTINKSNGITELDLTEFDKKDIEKFIQILTENTVANTV